MLKNTLDYYKETLEPMFEAKIRNINGKGIYELNRHMDLLDNQIESVANSSLEPSDIVIELYSRFSKEIFDRLTPNKQVYEARRIVEPAFLEDILKPMLKVLDREDFCRTNKIVNPQEVEYVEEFLIVIETFINIINQEISSTIATVLKQDVKEKESLPKTDIEDEVSFDRLPNRY